MRNVLNLIGESVVVSHREGLSEGVFDSCVDEKTEEDNFVDLKGDSWRQLMIEKCCESSGVLS